MDIGRIPPQDIEVEKAVLGAMLLSKRIIPTGMEMLSSDAFYKMEHRFIFKAIVALNSEGKEVDSLTITDQLRKEGELQKIGGPAEIIGLTNQIASDAHFERHCLILKERQMARKFIDVGSMLVKRGYDDTEDVFELTEYMADMVHEVQHISDIKTETTNTDLCNQLKEEIEQAKSKQGITGVPTGFKEQDVLFGGWQSPDFIVMAARPGMGKTAKMLCDVFNMATIHRRTVMIFSLEMSALQLFKRLASLATKIDANKFRTGQMSDDDWSNFHENISKILTDRIIIVDNCNTMQEIRNKIKRTRMERAVDCVYIDYLQLIEGPGQNREQEISKISRNCKNLAREINAPIIALSQLSREVDKRGNKRPLLTDLRESGAIEQDTDVVVFLYRPQYYYKPGDEQYEEGAAYLIVAKHRNGSLKDIKFRYVHERTQFVEWVETELF